MKQVIWGCVGCGDVCERKGGPPLYQVKGCRLSGCTRRDRAKGEDFARRHGPCRYYPTFDELLAAPEINAVYVATPAECHEPQSIQAARAGKHVLVEKPMAIDAAGCQRIIDVCRDQNVILAVAYYRRCYPTMLRARQLLSEGAIGRIRTLRINDEFPLSHRLDLVHFFLGDLAEVSSRAENLPAGSHAAEGAVLHAFTSAGAEAVTNIGWKETGAAETVEIVGETGRIMVDDLKGGTMTVTRSGGTSSETPGPLPFTHWGLIENFVAHFNGKAPLACNGVEGRKSTVILDIVEKLVPGGSSVAADYAITSQRVRKGKDRFDP